MVGGDSLSETVDFAALAEEMGACLKADPAFAAELIAACLNGGNPAILAIAIRAIMRAEGREGLTEPTLADFLAITKRLGFTVRADGDSWGIGPFPGFDEFENRFTGPRFTVPTLEHEGYIAMLEVDVNASRIRGRFVNAYSFPDFFGQTVDGTKAAFREVIRRENEWAENGGLQPDQPGEQKLPCLLPTQFDERFPNLTKARADTEKVFINMNHCLEEMRERGFLEELSVDQSKNLTISDYQSGLYLISSFIGNYAPMPTKIGWIIGRLSAELSLIAAGRQPQFLRPAAYSGTKTASPKHRALRLECACTVASLMRRGMSRDDACKAVANLLNKMKVSTKKNGSAISARAVLSFYDAVRRESEKQGIPCHEAGNTYSDANAFVIGKHLDNIFRDFGSDRAEKIMDLPELLGLPPLQVLREKLDFLSPIA